MKTNEAQADGVRRGMEMALAAINAERLHDPTDSADDRAYEMAIEDCDSAVRTLIAALPLAQEDAKDAATPSSIVRDAELTDRDLMRLVELELEYVRLFSFGTADVETANERFDEFCKRYGRAVIAAMRTEAEKRATDTKGGA